MKEAMHLLQMTLAMPDDFLKHGQTVYTAFAKVIASIGGALPL